MGCYVCRLAYPHFEADAEFASCREYDPHPIDQEVVDEINFEERGQLLDKLEDTLNGLGYDATAEGNDRKS
jgi:hypothetical protein